MPVFHCFNGEFLLIESLCWQFVQRELGGESGSRSALAASTSSVGDAAATITKATTAVLNKMLNVCGDP